MRYEERIERELVHKIPIMIQNVQNMILNFKEGNKRNVLYKNFKVPSTSRK